MADVEVLKTSKPDALRREFRMTYRGLAPSILTHEACRYLEVLVAKPIAVISHLFPSLRSMWLLKIIQLFHQKSVQAVLKTKAVLGTKDIIYTFMKFAGEKASCFPEAWYERPHQT